LLDAADIVKTKLVSGEAHTKCSECEEDHVEEHVVLDGSDSVATLVAEASLAKAVFGHDAGAGNIVVVPRHSEGVSHGAVCSLLMERLQDVSACFVCFVGSFVSSCLCDLCVCSKLAISLMKVAKMITTEGNNDDLWRRVA
jgi:hypothetical protein